MPSTDKRKRPGGSRGFYAREMTDAQYMNKLRSRCDISSGCWIWRGPLFTRGYGCIRYRNKNWATHRLAYALSVGPIPAGMFVCHRCDTPACCNPDHLFLGTHTDNQRDMVAKGRHASSKKTHCIKGHPLSGENVSLQTQRGGSIRRVCKTCQREAKHAVP